MSDQPKPRVRCTDPPQAMCGYCGEWAPLAELRCAPAGPFQQHALLGNNWPIHESCYMEWFDRL